MSVQNINTNREIKQINKLKVYSYTMMAWIDNGRRHKVLVFLEHLHWLNISGPVTDCVHV